MAKITQYPAKTVPSNNDEFVLHDTAAGSTKKMTRGDLIGGAPLPANSVDSQAIADGAVTNSKLMVTRTTSSGWSVISLGNIAILTIKTDSRSTSTGSATQTTNLPSGLLSSILSVNATATEMTGEARVVVTASSTSTSAVVLNYATTNGSGTARAFITVIGVLA